MSKSAVEKMRLSDELMFTKHLLSGNVPPVAQKQAFNSLVRRAFRIRNDTYAKGYELLRHAVKRHRHSRLAFALFLYRTGLPYHLYEKLIRLGKLIHPLSPH